MKTFVLSLLAIGLGSSLSAQKLYAHVNGNYGLGTNGSLLYDFFGNSNLAVYESEGYYNSNNATSNGSFKVANKSLGQGTRFGAAIGYKVKDHIALELAGEYLMGKTHEGSATMNYINSNQDNSSMTSEASLRQFRLIPSMVVDLGGEKFNPYVKGGLILPVAGKLTTKMNMVSNDNGRKTNTERTTEIKSRISVGVQAGVGATFELSDKLAMFCEINHQAMSYVFKSAAITEFKVDGVNELPSLDREIKETEYVKEMTYSSNSYNSDQPSQAPIQSFSMSNTGLGLGLKVSF